MTDAPNGRIEIVMPGNEHSAVRVWVATNSAEVRIVKLGPFGTFLVIFGLLAVLWLGFLFMSGVLLIVVPFFIAIALGAYLIGLLGFHRPR
jgi:hypothetical protein